MLYVHTPREVAYHCVSFMKKVNESCGSTNFNIELFEKDSKLDSAFCFVKISDDNCSTEFATRKFAWYRAMRLLRKSKWHITNTQNGEGICVSI